MSANASVYRIALTPGEPAGIGPDVCIQAAQQAFEHELVAFADPELLRERASQLQLDLSIELANLNEPPRPSAARTLKVVPIKLKRAVVAGELNSDNAAYVLETLTQAAQACQRGDCQAMVTAPVHKGIINDAGTPFSGHTEFLEALTGSSKVVMMLATEGLKVALATTHLPLKDVAGKLRAGMLREVLQITHDELQDRFGIDNPHILVCGLNPHAGEGGHLGDEEIRIISPVIEQLKLCGMSLEGPLPADTLFTPKYLDRADAVLAMYHDQGLPVLKFKGFGRAANITLGMPIIRTSVDHGTALDLAGTGKADVGSLLTAIDYAIQMARASGARR